MKKKKVTFDMVLEHDLGIPVFLLGKGQVFLLGLHG